MKKLASKYNHKKVEAHKNDEWIAQKYFQTHNKKKKPFTIVIPPPNVTGRLHLGHAWDTTLQDVLIRYKKMQGFDTMWIPGMDHAGIATQAKVEEKLRENNISRYDLGREKFIAKVWDWKEDYAQVIREQWGKLGLGLDYAKERFTLDEGLSQAVSKIFVDLYNKGLIYRGERIINWDPVAKTALSNIEVIHEEVNGYEYYFKYALVDEPEKYLEIMTTRPETIFGDGAIAVNPKDERYQKYLGQKVIVPLTGAQIPIIEDEYVDMKTGSGCVKITLAHDPNDFMVGQRHEVPIKVILNEDATMADNEYVLDEFKGLDRFEARKLFIKEAKKQDVFIKQVEMMHNVGHSERSGVIVEPYLSKQWFVDMEAVAEHAINFQDGPDKINFYPARFEKTFLQWMANIEDWCISRQLWWGHQIPAWYHKVSGEVYVGIEPPEDIENYTQDPDVLDTWFSSGLWPFSSLGWPSETGDLARYYPTDVLVTGYDIIFFWIARMIFTALEFLDEKPFKDVLVHGLVRDEQGRKMSKSLDNGVDPMDVIEQYGADSLRYFLVTNATPGQDLRYSEEKIAATWNFINKVWNAAQFVMMNTDEKPDRKIDKTKLSIADKWILTKLNETIEEVTLNMEKYEYPNVGTALYNFIWDDYCSWYLELAKASGDNKATKQVLPCVLKASLQMLNPFIPFVTEEIYTSLTGEETIITSEYPKSNKEYHFDNTLMELTMEAIGKFREIRQEFGVKKATAINYQTDLDVKESEVFIERLVNFKREDTKMSGKIETLVLSNGTKVLVDLSMVQETSVADQKKEYQPQLDNLAKEIARAKQMLNNESFMAKAPAEKIADEKSKLANYQSQHDELQKLMDELHK
jgi:valyl-tRNA synthetase